MRVYTDVVPHSVTEYVNEHGEGACSYPFFLTLESARIGGEAALCAECDLRYRWVQLLPRTAQRQTPALQMKSHGLTALVMALVLQVFANVRDDGDEVVYPDLPETMAEMKTKAKPARTTLNPHAWRWIEKGFTLSEGARLGLVSVHLPSFTLHRISGIPDSIPHALRLVTLDKSLSRVERLAERCTAMARRSIVSAERVISGITENSVTLSMGVEEAIRGGYEDGW